MVKREPTPPIEDDTKFLIINHPYPLHAAPVIEEERVKLAHWLASCIGQDHLIAIYYKPTAPSVVIIEILENCPQLNSLLGAHKWRKFLREPEPEQMERESRIYYCRYSTGREVQKYGWRRIDVRDAWFKNYDPTNGEFVTDPYPQAGFCEVPPETEADYALCRPLPTDVFPRPKPTKQKPIVPGSEDYVNIKRSGQQPTAAPTAPKKSAKSWASMLSSSSPTPTSSRTASTDASSISSPTYDYGSNTFSSPPPGLGPPGLSLSPLQKSSEWDFERTVSPVSASDMSEKVEIITSGLASAAIKDYVRRMNSTDTEKSGRTIQEGDYVDVPDQPVDWDKPICPVHKVACRAGICKAMYDIQKKKKREMEAAIRQKQKQESEDGDGKDGDGWETVKSRGRGRGRGQGWTRGRARGAQGRKGSWC